MRALRRSSFALVAAVGLAAAPAATGQDSYPLYFPATAEDLPFGHFWYYPANHSIPGANANDFTGIRYDEATKSWQPDVHDLTVLRSDTVLWSVPVYAAADGEVISCWREFSDGLNGLDPFNPGVQTNGGNHLLVRDSDGTAVFYAHLQKDSIPVSLCPNTGTLGAPSNINNQSGDFPSEYIVPAAQRATVKTGQYLGSVGHNGKSSGPHLHIHVQEIPESAPGVFSTGATVPHRFYGASKVQGFSDGSISENWTSVNGHVFTQLIDSGKIIVMPEEARRSSLSSRAVGRLDVVSRSRDRQLQIMTWNGQSWSGWTKLGGTLTSNLACASWESARIDCFGRGTDMALQHIYWTEAGGWSGWTGHGGLLTSAPAVVAREKDRLDVFVRGKDFGLWRKSWNGASWSGWSSLGGKLNSSPACASWAEDRIDCFVRGRNSGLWHIYWNGESWSEWNDHGGSLTSAPSVATRGRDRLDIFARGQNQHLWIKQWDGAWGNWTDLGGVLASGPSAVSWGSSRLDVQAVGQNGNLWHLYWTPSGWSQWSDRGPFFE